MLEFLSPVLVLALVIGGVPFIITQKNARYLLSGYNTMSEKERAQVDIQGLLRFMRKRFFLLALSMVVLGILIRYFFGIAPATIFIPLYLLAGVVIFSFQSRRYYSGSTNKQSRWTALVLAVPFLIIACVLYFGLGEDRIVIESDMLRVEGLYSEDISFDEITGVDLVDRLPPISYRSNGISLGEVHKGFYKTKSGDEVKLLINCTSDTLLRITRRSGVPIYYSDGDRGQMQLYEGIFERKADKK